MVNEKSDPNPVVADVNHAAIRVVNQSKEFDGEIVFRGRAPFSHSVSKSFTNNQISSMTIHLSHYRIFKSKSKGDLHAEFLIVVSFGSTSTVTFGVWKRFDSIIFNEFVFI